MQGGIWNDTSEGFTLDRALVLRFRTVPLVVDRELSNIAEMRAGLCGVYVMTLRCGFDSRAKYLWGDV